MKKITFSFIAFLFFSLSMQAQLLLDVEGDGWIRKRLIVGNTNDRNLFIGHNAGIANTNSIDNIFIGVSTGGSNTTGGGNTFIGTFSGSNNTTGVANTILGVSSGRSITTAMGNTILGARAGMLSTGDFNTFVGNFAGFGNTTGVRNTLLGVSADVLSPDLINATALGYATKVGCNNCTVIGSAGVKVGIATSTPLSDLHIKQSLDTVPAGIRMERAANSNQWTTYVDKFNDYNFTYNNNLRAWIDDNGVIGSLNFTNQTSTSRSRKSKPKELGKVLDKVNKLHPLSFKKDDSEKNQNIWGFNNEEVSKLFPTITPEKNGQKGIIYDYLGILSIKAIQELSVLVEEQQAEIVNREELIQNQQTAINELKSNVTELQSDVVELKSMLAQVLQEEKTNNTQSAMLEETRLGQNLPNPFNSSTQIPYTIPDSAQKANILIHSINGQVIKTIAINAFGEGILELQTVGLSKGQYTYSLEVDGRLVETKQMQLVR